MMGDDSDPCTCGKKRSKCKNEKGSDIVAETKQRLINFKDSVFCSSGSYDTLFNDYYLKFQRTRLEAIKKTRTLLETIENKARESKCRMDQQIKELSDCIKIKEEQFKEAKAKLDEEKRCRDKCRKS